MFTINKGEMEKQRMSLKRNNLLNKAVLHLSNKKKCTNCKLKLVYKSSQINMHMQTSCAQHPFQSPKQLRTKQFFLQHSHCFLLVVLYVFFDLTRTASVTHERSLCHSHFRSHEGHSSNADEKQRFLKNSENCENVLT